MHAYIQSSFEKQTSKCKLLNNCVFVCVCVDLNVITTRRIFVSPFRFKLLSRITFLLSSENTSTFSGHLLHHLLYSVLSSPKLWGRNQRIMKFLLMWRASYSQAIFVAWTGWCWKQSIVMSIFLGSLEAPLLESLNCKFPEVAAGFQQFTTYRISPLNFKKNDPQTENCFE